MRRIALFLAGLSLAVACTTSPRPGALEPRYVAVHNTLAAMGLASSGPIQRGTLAEGRETRLAVDLPSDCATVVAIGGADVHDLDLSVFDADDKLLGKDTTSDAEAAVKICPPHGGRFTLVVKMTRGNGDFIVATWSGGGGPAAPAGSAVAVASGAGTCASPIALPTGASTGNTRKGESEHQGKCGNADGREIVYRLELDKKQRVTIEVDPTSFDSLIYLRRDDCEDNESEVGCNDDYQAGTSKRSIHSRGSRLEEVVEPGTYFLFVDSFGSEAGNYRMNVELADVPVLADTCRQAKPLISHVNGTLTNAFDQLHGSCDSGLGPEVPYRLDLPSKARARVTMHSDDFSPVLHLRKACTDDASEVSCTSSGMKSTEAALVATLEQGSYTVFADSTEKGARGRFAVDVDLTPDGGKGVRGDACGDAITIAPDDKLVDGDTFDAKDDFTPKCAASGAADMMYRFELAVRSRVTARFEAEEGSHVFSLSRSCTDRTTELACNTHLDEVLAPGTYYLAVDGTAQAPFGRFQFKLRAKDVSLQEAACKAVPSIALGQTVTGTTAGAPDRFAVSCGGRAEAQTSGDRVFKLTLPTQQHVQLLLTTPTHDGVLALRKTCLDPPGMKQVREAETACNNDSPDTRHSKIDVTLSAGTHYVVVDGHQGKNEGPFTLEAKALSTPGKPPPPGPHSK